MDNLAHKCRWEHMTRLAIILEYQNTDLICDDCKKIIGLEKINERNISEHK